MAEYNLNAVLSAENRAGSAINQLEAQIGGLEDRLDALDKKKAAPSLSVEDGAFNRGMGEAENRLEKFDGKKATAELDVKILEALGKVSQVENRLGTFDGKSYKASLDVESASAESKVARATSVAERWDGEKYVAQLDAESSGAEAKIARVTAFAQELDRTKATVTTDADTAGATAKLGAMQRLLQAFDKTLNIQVDADTSAATARLTALQGVMGRAGGSADSLRGRLLNLGTATAVAGIPILIAGIGGIIPVAGAAAVGITALASAITAGLVGAAAAGVGAIGALVAGIGLLAAPIALNVSALTKYQQSIDQVKAAQQSAQAASQAYGQAQQGVRDAVANVGVVEQQVAEQIKGAREARAAAYRNEAQVAEQTRLAVAQGEEQVEASRETLEQATDALRVTQDELNAAMRDEPLNQWEAELNLADARDAASDSTRAYNEAVKEYGANSEEASDAARAMERAELGLQRTTQETNDIRKNGSQELQSAQAAEQDALKSRQAAQDGVRSSVQALNRTIQDGARQQAEAARASRAAEEGVQKAREDGARQLQAANDAVTRAQEAAAQALKAQQEAQQGVLDKTVTLTAAQKRLYDEAMRFGRIGKEVFAPATDEVARLGTSVIGLAIRALPSLGAAALDVARHAREAFAAIRGNLVNPQQIRIFERFLAGIGPSFQLALRAVGNFGIGLFNVFERTLPLGNELLSWLARLAREFVRFTRSADGQNRIDAFLSRAASRGRQLWAVIRDLVVGIVDFGRAVNRAGLDDRMMRGLQRLAAGFRNVTRDGSAGQRAITDFARQSGPLLTSIGRAFGELFRQVGRVARELIGFRTNGSRLTVLQQIFRAIRDSFKPLADLLIATFKDLGPILPPLIRNIGRMLEVFAGSTPVLRVYLQAINRLMEIFLGLPGWMQGAIASFVVLRTLLGGGGGGAGLVTTFLAMRGASALLGPALTRVGLGGGAASLSLRAVALAIGRIAWPIGLAIAFKDSIFSLGKNAGDIIGELDKAAAGQQTWGQAFKNSKPHVAEFTKTLKADALAVGEWYVKFIEGIPVLGEWAKALAKTEEAAGNTARDVTKNLSLMSDQVVGNSIIPDMVRSVVEWFGRMGVGATEMVGSMAEGVYRSLGNLVQGIWDRAQGIYDALVAPFNAADEDTHRNSIVPDMVTAILGHLGSMGARIRRAMSDVPDAIGEPFREGARRAGTGAEGVGAGARRGGRDAAPQGPQRAVDAAAISERRAEALQARGWAGNPNDSRERLYSPSHAMNPGGAGSRGNDAAAGMRDQERDTKRSVDSILGEHRRLQQSSRETSERLGEDARRGGRSLEREGGQGIERFAKEGSDNLRRLGREGGRGVEDLARDVTRSAQRMGRDAGRHTEDLARQVTRNMGDMGRSGSREADSLSRNATGSLDRMGRDIERSVGQTREQSNRSFSDLQQHGTRESETLQRNAINRTDEMGRGMIDRVGSMRKTNEQSFTDYQKKGTAESDLLKRNAIDRTEGMRKDVTAKTDLMRRDGSADFTEFQKKGTAESDLLRRNGIDRMEKMKAGVKRETAIMRTDSLKTLEDLRDTGGQIMSTAGLKMSQPIGKSRDVQGGYLADMLKAYEDFAKEVGLDIGTSGKGKGAPAGGTDSSSGSMGGNPPPESGSAHSGGRGTPNMAQGGLLDGSTVPQMPAIGGVARTPHAVFGEAGEEAYVRTDAFTPQSAHALAYANKKWAQQGWMDRVPQMAAGGVLKEMARDIKRLAGDRVAIAELPDGNAVPLPRNRSGHGRAEPGSLEERLLGREWATAPAAGGGSGGWPPNNNWNIGGSGPIGYTASSAAASMASQAAGAWPSGWITQGGGDVQVSVAELGGALRGLTYNTGKVLYDPAIQVTGATHEWGHTLNLGHGGTGIMGGGGAINDADLAAAAEYRGLSLGDAGGDAAGRRGDRSNLARDGRGASGGINQSGSGSGITQTQVGTGPQRQFHRQIGQAQGGILRPDDLRRRSLGQEEAARNVGFRHTQPRGGRNKLTTRANPAGGEGVGPTMHTYIPELRDVVDRVNQNFDVYTNTYSNHPPGYAQPYYRERSFDSWDAAGRGSALATELGNQVQDWIINNVPELNWLIWGDKMLTASGWGPDTSGFNHNTHVHATAFAEGAMANGGAKGSGPDYRAQLEAALPNPPTFPSHTVGNTASRSSANLRTALLNLVPAGDGTSPGATQAFSGDWASAKGGDPSVNRGIGEAAAKELGWGSQWGAWEELGNRESGWDRYAKNASSGAYGIPQALPESKLPPAGQSSGGSQAGPQVAWMANYIKDRYTDPQGALAAHDRQGWYTGGGLAIRPQLAGVAEHGPELMLPMNDPATADRFGEFIRNVRGRGTDNEELAARLRDLREADDFRRRSGPGARGHRGDAPDVVAPAPDRSFDPRDFGPRDPGGRGGGGPSATEIREAVGSAFGEAVRAQTKELKAEFREQNRVMAEDLAPSMGEEFAGAHDYREAQNPDTRRANARRERTNRRRNESHGPVINPRGGGR